jgi:hypothetical protein
MRIYLGIAGTGGKVLGSFEVAKIYKYKYDLDLDLYCYHCFGLSKTIKHKNNIGCTGQKYAIEIKDFRKEDLTIDDFTKYYNPMEETFDSGHLINKLPQSFMYIKEPYVEYETKSKAILMPIHQEWFDKIASDEKKWEFRNKLPKALNGE